VHAGPWSYIGVHGIGAAESCESSGCSLSVDLLYWQLLLPPVLCSCSYPFEIHDDALVLRKMLEQDNMQKLTGGVQDALRVLRCPCG
jgi:hypothetical protein